MLQAERRDKAVAASNRLESTGKLFPLVDRVALAWHYRRVGSYR